MKETRNVLMFLFWLMVGLSTLTVLLFETDMLESGTAAGGNATAEFITTVMMELMTITSIPLALKMFKMKRIQKELVEGKAIALRKWGVLRLSMLEVPLLANTLFYYIYMNTTFGYMAIILLICLAFVYPSMNRCLADVENTEETGNG